MSNSKDKKNSTRSSEEILIDMCFHFSILMEYQLMDVQHLVLEFVLQMSNVLENSMMWKVRRPGVNFNNVLRAAFTYVSCARSFLCLHLSFVLYWRKTTGVKAARRTLVKLTPGLDTIKNKLLLLPLLWLSRRSSITKELFIIFVK